MSKKTWSVILLCLMAACLAAAALILVCTGASMAQMDVNTDPGEDSLPLAKLAAFAFAAASLYIGFCILEVPILFIGWTASLINIKIAYCKEVKAVSVGFFAFYSAAFILIAAFAVYVLAGLT